MTRLIIIALYSVFYTFCNATLAFSCLQYILKRKYAESMKLVHFFQKFTSDCELLSTFLHVAKETSRDNKQ